VPGEMWAESSLISAKHNLICMQKTIYAETVQFVNISLLPGSPRLDTVSKVQAKRIRIRRLDLLATLLLMQPRMQLGICGQKVTRTGLMLNFLPTWTLKSFFAKLLLV